MKIIITVSFILVSISLAAQALRDLNYRYMYDPDESFSLTLRPVRTAGGWKILYALQLRDTAGQNAYQIQWSGRDGLTAKDDIALPDPANQWSGKNDTEIFGSLPIPSGEAPKIVVAKVVNAIQKRAWFFYTTLEDNYPGNNDLEFSGNPLLQKYVATSGGITSKDRKSLIVSYYNESFPAAAPAFSEGQARVSKLMQTDSVFVMAAGDTLVPPKKGLYLFQSDTLAAEGTAIRADDDYPRFTRVENLPGPLIYICTKQEYDRLEIAKSDKKTFDRTVLSITGDVDRARKLMRNYFRRVELANQYFSSYKEGWKTDRGMIYIIFGLPDEVFRFADREVWNYKNELFDTAFHFTKSPSVFDPDNYVLIRDKKYKDTWYEVIDLWRNARF